MIAKTRHQFYRIVGALTLSRLFIDMMRRFPYPFVTTISRLLGVPVTGVQNVLAMQAGIGVLSPLFGALSDRYGCKRVPVGAMMFMVAASAVGALLPQFWVFSLVLIAYGFGKMLFNPAMQAYLGAFVPYRQRARALGITELSWAGSLIIAAPVAGLLLETTGIQAIFALITGLMIAALAFVVFFLPSDTPDKHAPRTPVNPLAAWQLIRQTPEGVSALVYTLLLVSANEIFFINYGIWMEVSFDLVLTALGLVTVVIAAAEVLGEGLVIGIADRFGSRRLALIGAAGGGFSYLVMPALNFSLPLTLAGLFVMFLCVETAIVASLPIFTEILPNSRAVMMSGIVGAHSLGRLIGAAFGSALYAATQDFLLVSVLAAIIGVATAIILWRFVHENDTAGT